MTQSADSHISPEERHQLLKWIDESHQEFLRAVDGVSETQWTWQPAPARWSVGETAEHIVLAEALLFGFTVRALGTPANPDWNEQTKNKTDLLMRLMPARQAKAVAPEPIMPREKTNISSGQRAIQSPAC